MVHGVMQQGKCLITPTPAGLDSPETVFRNSSLRILWPEHALPDVQRGSSQLLRFVIVAFVRQNSSQIVQGKTVDW